ncbi:uncharacterized protein RB166_005711 [Leptodactylus fuscus]
MESRRDRPSEREPLSSSQDTVIREITSMDISPSPEDSAKSTGKKPHQGHTKSSIMPSSHHRSSQSLDRHGHSSSTNGALALQSLVGRSGSSSSSISGITVPIRLDALSYLLNNAVLGAHNTSTQMPCYPSMYPAYPYTQVGACVNSLSWNMPYMNQFPAYQPGVMPYGTQQGVQACQNPVLNFNQCIGGIAPNQNDPLFSSIPPSSGTSFNTSAVNMTPSLQDNRGNFPLASNMLPPKSNDVFGDNKGNPFSSNYEKPSSLQRGSVRLGDKQSEDSLSGRSQNSFGKGSGRGRGDCGGRSWQGYSNGQERRFGDRSGNMDSGGRKRFQDSPDRFKDRGNSFKCGHWQDGRGRDGEIPESWQQKNRQSFSPPWSKAETSQDRFKTKKEEKIVAKTEESKVQDENWEMDYAEEPATSKTSNHSPSSSLLPSAKNCNSPQTLKPPDTDNKDEDLSVKGFASSPAQEKEEGEWESCSNKAIEIKPEVNDKDPVLSPMDNPIENTVKVEEMEAEEICTFIISGDDDKPILVAVDPEDQLRDKRLQSSCQGIRMKLSEFHAWVLMGSCLSNPTTKIEDWNLRAKLVNAPQEQKLVLKLIRRRGECPTEHKNGGAGMDDCCAESTGETPPVLSKHNKEKFKNSGADPQDKDNISGSIPEPMQ